MGSASVATRQLGSVLLIILGGIALVGGILTRYADRNLLDPERFSERAVEVLDDEGAQSEIGDVIVNELEKLGASRGPTRRVVDARMGRLAADERFRAGLTTALVTANKQALGAGEDGVEVTVTNIGAPLGDILGKGQPELAKLIEPGLDLPVANTGATGALVGVARAADGVSSLSLILPLLGGLLILGGVLIANDRRTALFGAAMGVALAGLAVFVGYIGGREIAARLPEDAAAQDAARAIWSAVFGGLETLGLTMAGAGALVALVAGLVFRRSGQERF